jgi:hypothetical protein
MLKIENSEIVGWEHAIRGMRNAMNSWDKSDSCVKGFVWCNEFYDGLRVGPNDGKLMKSLRIGPNDGKLMKSLCISGTNHRKFMRMIVVYLDITAPLYWWKEFDTYKVGTVTNSCSTMHKIHAKEFTLDDFSIEHLIGEDSTPIDSNPQPYFIMTKVIKCLNHARDAYNMTVKSGYSPDVVKKMWWQMIQLLPTSYNQKRTVMLNYEVLTNIYKNRRNHKLDEWHIFCDWIEGLPYSELITGKFKEATDNGL